MTVKPSPRRGVALLATLAGASWLPLAVGIAGITAVLLLWQSLLSAERGQLAFMGDTQARSVASELQRAFQLITQSFATMAQRHGAVLRGGEPFHLEITGLEATAWAEPSGKVRRVEPPKGNHDLADADLTVRDADRLALLEARQSGQPVVTHSIVLPGGSPVFHLMVPISDEGRLSGFIVGVFSERTLGRAVLERDAAPRWAFAVFEADRELYRTGSPVGGRWMAQSTFKIADTERRLLVSAGPELIARLRGPVPDVVLATGLVISLLLVASVGLAQAARRRARESEAAYVALRVSEARKSAMIEASLDSIVMMDRHGNIVDFNAAAEKTFGYSRAEAIGRLLADLLIPQRLRERHRQGLKAYLATGEGPVLGRRLELEAIRSDGSEFPVEVSIIALHTDVPLFMGFIRDLSAAKRAEEARRRNEEQYRLLFDSNPQPMWVYDEETLAFLAVNDAAVRHYGYSRNEFLTMTIRDVHPSEETQTIEEYLIPAAQQGEREAVRPLRVWKHRKKDGALIDVEIAVSPIEFRGRKARLKLATDVTEKKRLESQLLQSQKMESVGRLAGGIAHDFNNLLGVITGYGELLARRLPDDPGLRKYVGDIMKAAERAADLTRQLLAFSRKQVLQPRILDLNTAVGEMEKMLQRLIGEDIQLVTLFADRLGRVKADPGQIEQVIMNLAVNARDAMPRGGRLTIETANVNLDAAYARSRPGVEPGPHVVLAVSDTGHGMDQEALSHLFEPFFTTKEPGKGTGLGLATVHGIVRQSGGHIFVYSEPGHGTTLKIYLPRLEQAAEVPTTVSAEAEEPRGSETVLLVEDEASLRNLVRECLEASGYTVLEARHAGHALEIAEGHSAPIHLLMTDVVMPGMSGRELAHCLAASHPGMKVLYMSGYTDDAVVLHGVLAAEVAFLQKPFTAEALARKLREVLDR